MVMSAAAARSQSKAAQVRQNQITDALAEVAKAIQTATLDGRFCAVASIEPRVSKEIRDVLKSKGYKVAQDDATQIQIRWDDDN